MKKNIFLFFVILQLILCWIYVPKYFVKESEEALQKEITKDKFQLISKLLEIIGKESLNQENEGIMVGLYLNLNVTGNFYKPNKNQYTDDIVHGRLFNYRRNNSFTINNKKFTAGSNEYFDYVFEPIGYPIKEIRAIVSPQKKDTSHVEIFIHSEERGDIGFDGNSSGNIQFINSIYNNIYQQIYARGEYDLEENQYHKFSLIKNIIKTNFFDFKIDDIHESRAGFWGLFATFNGVKYNMQVAGKVVNQRIYYFINNDKILNRRIEIIDSNKIYWQLIVFVNSALVLSFIFFRFKK
jgi:hypothetical protein